MQLNPIQMVFKTITFEGFSLANPTDAFWSRCFTPTKYEVDIVSTWEPTESKIQFLKSFLPIQRKSTTMRCKVITF